MVLTSFLIFILVAGWRLSAFNPEFPSVAKWHRQRPAQELEKWLQTWQLSMAQGGALNRMGEVPEYKFFGRLALQGLAHARSFGAFPRELIWEWRQGLKEEDQYEQKARSLYQSSLAQFLVFASITWAFILLALKTTATPLPLPLLVSVASLQLAGLGLFPLVLKLLSRKRLSGYAEVLESLYTLRSLSQAGLPAQRVLQEAKMETVERVRQPALRPLRQQLLELAQLYQQQGAPLQKESQLLLQEAWFQRTQALGQLIKITEHLKLGFLLVFFAGAYGLFLFGLLQHFLGASSG